MAVWQGAPKGWGVRAGPRGATLSFLWRLLAGFFRTGKAAPKADFVRERCWARTQDCVPWQRFIWGSPRHSVGQGTEGPQGKAPPFSGFHGLCLKKVPDQPWPCHVLLTPMAPGVKCYRQLHPLLFRGASGTASPPALH